VNGDGGGIVFVEGVSGMGKTRFSEEIAYGQRLSELREQCIVLVGVGRARRQAETFYPWRQVFRQAFLVDSERSAARQSMLDKNGPSMALTHEGNDEQIVKVTDLALHVRDSIPDYASWRATLASALGLPASELPPAVPETSLSRSFATDAPTECGLPSYSPRSASTHHKVGSPGLIGGGRSKTF